MISWMQKHHKYMVWTIWVAAIGFIGAGSVGWGSLHFGSKATSVAKVGTIEISQQKINQAYSDLYSRYAQLFKGNFDDQKAKELGLLQQAFARVEVQAKLLNFAKENGIIVTDEEVAQQIASIPAFLTQDGKFDKKAYKTFLQNRHMKAKDFESTLKDDLTIQKTLSLLNLKVQPLEMESIASSMNIADKIAYKTISSDDINISIDDAKLKEFWNEHKTEYQTNTIYELAIIWEKNHDINATEDEMKSYYEANSFNFTDNNGKLLSFQEAKEQIKTKMELKATKKSAQLDYIALKKGKLAQPKTTKLTKNDTLLTQDVWNEIANKQKGDILKPKIINNKYAIIKIVSIIEPRTKTFEEAKDEVKTIYIAKLKKEKMLELAEKSVKNLQDNNPIITDFVKMDSIDKIQNLTKEESLHFLQNLFISNKEKAIIELSDKKVVVYNILEQRIEPVDNNMSKIIKPIVNKLKTELYQANLIDELNSKYKTEVYVKGLTK